MINSVDLVQAELSDLGRKMSGRRTLLRVSNTRSSTYIDLTNLDTIQLNPHCKTIRCRVTSNKSLDLKEAVIDEEASVKVLETDLAKVRERLVLAAERADLNCRQYKRNFINEVIDHLGTEGDKVPLFQPRLIRKPFWMIVACQLVNRTQWASARVVLGQIMKRWDGPYKLQQADFQELTDMLHPLGFQNRRARQLIRLAQAWPESGQPSIEQLAKMEGVGEYATQSWLIFVKGKLPLGVSDEKLTSHLENILGEEMKEDKLLYAFRMFENVPMVLAFTNEEDTKHDAQKGAIIIREEADIAKIKMADRLAIYNKLAGASLKKFAGGKKESLKVTFRIMQLKAIAFKGKEETTMATKAKKQTKKAGRKPAMTGTLTKVPIEKSQIKRGLREGSLRDVCYKALKSGATVEKFLEACKKAKVAEAKARGALGYLVKFGAVKVKA